MSLFGPITDDDERRWQQRNLKALTQLVHLGAKKKLTPLFWTLPGIGGVTGKVHSHTSHDPRVVFEAWYQALSSLPQVEPRGSGLRDEGPARSEWSPSDGQTRLWAGFTLRLPEGRCDVTLLAEWFAEDLVQAVEQ